jgi:hypothetical protein
MFQNVLTWISRYQEKEKKFVFNFFWNFYVFPISYTRKYVISYKCKYELFHLNMLKLFQEINNGANMLMQKVST